MCSLHHKQSSLDVHQVTDLVLLLTCDNSAELITTPMEQ